MSDKKDEAFKSGSKILIIMTPVLVAFTWALLSSMPEALKSTWFALHPIAMTFAVLLAFIPSILIRQIKGRMPTKIHGLFMVVACLLLLFGWYVIHTNKEEAGKPHLVSVHGQAGALMIFTLVFMTFTSFVALEPDYKVFVPKPVITYFKFSHKWGGRLIAIIMLFLLYTGFEKIFPSMTPIIIGLVFVAAVTLRSAYRSLVKRVV